jgi:hypothetical protein
MAAIGWFVKVQVMLSPATGVTAMLVPLPGCMTVPPVPLFVQRYVLIYSLMFVAPAPASLSVYAVPAVALNAAVDTLFAVPVEVALGPPLLIATVNWSAGAARPAMVFATVNTGAVAAAVCVPGFIDCSGTEMLSPLAGDRNPSLYGSHVFDPVEEDSDSAIG